MLFSCVSVISVPRKVAERLEPSDDSSGPSLIDYSEKCSLPITIPDCQSLDQDGEKFVVSVTFVLCYSNKRSPHSQLFSLMTSVTVIKHWLFLEIRFMSHSTHPELSGCITTLTVCNTP